MDRPANAPSPDHPLLLAMRYTDAEVEDHDLRTVVEKSGIGTLEDLYYCAEQRAIRIVLMQAGRLNEISPTEAVTVEFSDAQRATVDALTPVFLEALLMGWRAKELSER